MTHMDNIDRRIINQLQGGFPICEHPYREAAARLEISEGELLQRIEKLLHSGLLSRFGPMYHAEKMGGALTLAAMQVPEERFQEVTELVNDFPEVAHNYRREHTFNMWFVLACENSERIAQVLSDIERRSGVRVYNMPRQEEFFIDLRLKV
jgi:DNA-binding Lrp family transcriptional regulator